MDSIKAKIVEKLEHFPETTLQEVLDFVDFLEYRKVNNQETYLSTASNDTREKSDVEWLDTDLSNLGSYESYDWQPGELEEGLPVKYVPGEGVVIVRE
ncbi:hypothetical protein [Scytonema sp. NUACC26]|uniref:hypothetical protein n=1 Tax=Scytonema sp. NUACC26 TaxID=3140176 RepID=UPI0034DBF7B8